MTIQQIKQQSEYLKSQIKQYYDFEVMLDIGERDQSREFDGVLKRTDTVLKIFREAAELQDQDDFTDGQELTPIKIEIKIDNEKSDEQRHQFIESVETKNYVDDLLQAKQQPKQQHSTVEDATVKTIIQVRP
jgi:hypothetical protein